MGDDDENIADKFVNMEKIGEGTYGVVYKVRSKADNTLKAMKQIRLNQL
jgi:cyclin-dependent kinase 2